MCEEVGRTRERCGSLRGRSRRNHIKTVGTAFEEKIDVLGRWNSCSRPREEKRQPTHPSVLMKRQLSYCAVLYQAGHKNVSVGLLSGSSKVHVCNGNYAAKYPSTGTIRPVMLS